MQHPNLKIARRARSDDTTPADVRTGYSEGCGEKLSGRFRWLAHRVWTLPTSRRALGRRSPCIVRGRLLIASESARCFACHGMQPNQQVTFQSDGGEDVRSVQLYLHPEAEHLLDCFYVTVRLTVLKQFAKDCPRRLAKVKINMSCARACSKIWNPASGSCSTATCSWR